VEKTLKPLAITQAENIVALKIVRLILAVAFKRGS
jgi:hypothetical protein